MPRPELKNLNPKDLDVKPSVPEKEAPKFKEEGFVSQAKNIAGALSGYTQRNKVSADLAEGSYRLKYGN